MARRGSDARESAHNLGIRSQARVDVEQCDLGILDPLRHTLDARTMQVASVRTTEQRRNNAARITKTRTQTST
eukprot:3188555-Pyramimonas_sp.AAC.2